ncbi:MAG: hypothetical protein ACK4HD_13820, partial [Pannonibacter phragmitetus]
SNPLQRGMATPRRVSQLSGNYRLRTETGLFLNDIEALEEGGEEPLVERLQRAGITISARHEPVLP